MPEYIYSGVDKNGKRANGRMEAMNEGELRMALRAQGIRPTKIVKPGMANLASGLSRATISNEDLVVFTRQFGVLLSSGIPAVQALDILGDQQPRAGLKLILNGLKDKVSSGNYLWEAMSSYPKTFNKLYSSLIRAGESSGTLDGILRRLSEYLEESERLRKTLKSAMMYPAIVISIGIGVVSIMMVFVIPKFEELLKGAGQDLPMPTQVVITISHFMKNNFIWILLILAAGVVALKQFYGTDEGRALFDRLFYKAPIFGNLIRKAGIARFARVMQTLLSAGVNLVDAIDICKSTVGNVVIESAVASIRGEIEGGRTLGAVVAGLGVFPMMAVQMIAVGESTGNLDNMLGKVADFYEEEVRVLVGGMTKLIEPMVIVFLGGTVGGLLVAMYLPIFKLAGASG